MNVKSRFAPDEENVVDRRGQYMRGGCGTPFSMISGSTRMDVSNLRAPKFIQKFFRLLGWKTAPDQSRED